jgi:hypothetical protein
MNLLEEKILKNKDDLLEGTFCYELFENKVFDEKLFLDLIDTIDQYLCDCQKKKLNANKEVLTCIIWIITGIYRCVISHNDINDGYEIKNFNISSWYEKYEENVLSVLNQLVFRCNS